MVVRMMIFMLDNIGCLNEWVVSGGGVDGVVDAWDVVFDMISETNYSSKEFVF